MTLVDQTIQFLISGLTTGAVYSLIALGFCLIHNATGLMNFTQVDFVTLGGMMMYTFLNQVGLPMAPAILLSVASVALVGVALERLAIRPARGRSIILLIFITIGASHLIRGLIKVIWGKSSMALPPLGSERPFRILEATIMPQSLWIMGITLGAVALLHLFFTRTLYGKAMRAVAVDPRAAALMGIDVSRVVMVSFALAGGVGALAGLLIVPISTLTYDVGVMLGLKGFAAAVLGGYGHFFGAVVGGLVLGVVEALGAGLVSSTYKDVIAFVILLLVLFARPSGLMGAGETTRV
jgi:branched-chain amino acid transport system permease protein